MPSLFQTRFERVRSADLRSFGVSVVFRQEGRNTEAFDATWESPQSSTVGEEAFVNAKYSRKWRLSAASLVINGKEVKPAEGAVIKEVETGRRFQIVSSDDIPKPELTAGGYQWLVYTNQISDG